MSTVYTHDISRKEAANLLKVSVRTIDRHIKNQKLSTQHVNGRVMLSKEEVSAFNSDDRAHRSLNDSIIEVDSDLSILSTLSTSTDVDKVDAKNVNIVDTLSTHQKELDREIQNLYKKLYLDAKEELAQKQERLEIANYRVGQLEAQIRNSMSLLEYHRQNNVDIQKTEKLKAALENNHLQIKDLNQKIRYETLIKRLFAIGLLIILALQPLWLLFIYT